MGGRFRISPGFVAELALMWFFDFEGLLPVMLSCALLHELGHFVMLRCLGGRVARMSLTVFGACMEVAPVPRLTYLREALVCLAGPGTNFLAAAVCALLCRQGWDLYLAVGCHVILGLFNLLPAGMFDGGQTVYLLMLQFNTVERALRVRSVLTGLTGALLLLGGVWLFLATGYNLTVLLCGGCVVGMLFYQWRTGL